MIQADGAPVAAEGPLLTLGIAGHVDHGKTALVRALTGIETDRLAEEQRRGISIELGFAWLDLTQADGARQRVGLIDMPGHERFVRRMISGTSGIDAVLLCVAMFRPEKNQRELVELAAALPATGDWQLWLAGDGPARAACERLVARRQLAARVKFLGFHRDPTPLYRAADVAVHASRSESLSNFLIEAQAHGLPAVVYHAQGIAECFVPGVTGWVVPPGDRAAWIARLAPLLADPARRQACAAPARQHARQQFDAPRQVRAYLDLFTRLVGPAPAP